MEYIFGIIGLAIGAAIVFLIQKDKVDPAQIEEEKQKALANAERDFESRKQDLIASLRQEYENESQQQAGQIQEYQGRIQALESQIGQLQSKIAQLEPYESQVNELELKISGLEELEQSYQGQLQQLRDSFDAQIAQLQVNHQTELQAQIESVRQEYEQQIQHLRESLEQGQMEEIVSESVSEEEAGAAQSSSFPELEELIDYEPELAAEFPQGQETELDFEAREEEISSLPDLEVEAEGSSAELDSIIDSFSEIGAEIEPLESESETELSSEDLDLESLVESSVEPAEDLTIQEDFFGIGSEEETPIELGAEGDFDLESLVEAPSSPESPFAAPELDLEDNDEFDLSSLIDESAASEAKFSEEAMELSDDDFDIHSLLEDVPRKEEE